MDTVDNSLCMHQALNPHKHKFTFAEGSREAVQTLAHHVEQLQLNHEWYGTEHIYIFVDARSALDLPIRYLFEVLSDYNRPYPDLVPPKLTLALLRNPETVVLDVYHVMAELFDPPLTVQFFVDEDNAKRWLDEMSQ